MTQSHLNQLDNLAARIFFAIKAIAPEATLEIRHGEFIVCAPNSSDLIRRTKTDNPQLSAEYDALTTEEKNHVWQTCALMPLLTSHSIYERVTGD